MFVTTNYGSAFSGHMGVGIAFPRKTFQVVEVEMSRVATAIPQIDDERSEHREASSRSSWFSPVPLLSRVLGSLSGRNAPTSENVADDVWTRARQRENRVVMAKLRHIVSGRCFAVSTYHMPCAFRDLELMVVHTAVAAQLLQDFASKGEDACLPHVFLGDFNSKPGDPQYTMLVSGKSSSGFARLLKILGGPPTKLRSAYAAVQGKEPAFTNYARTEWDADPFVGTLDYVFYSREWHATDVTELPKSHEDLPGPLPLRDEPSDHLLISATLRMT
mmetsp:Transcript_53456/g.116094  ORF Transcript_53456/g.116094 Transcript_53456/m.116094 type:complete len:275 (+) Transcript_53456:302-1126(+)